MCGYMLLVVCLWIHIRMWTYGIQRFVAPEEPEGVSLADLKLSDWAWLLASRSRSPCVYTPALELECTPLYLASLCGS